MNVVTDFGIGDDVWVMYHGKATEITITKVMVVQTESTQVVTYYDKDATFQGSMSKSAIPFPSEDVFQTKEELL